MLWLVVGLSNWAKRHFFSWFSWNTPHNHSPMEQYQTHILPRIMSMTTSGYMTSAAMPKRKCKFTDGLKKKYPCFRLGCDASEAECGMLYTTPPPPPRPLFHTNSMLLCVSAWTARLFEASRLFMKNICHTTQNTTLMILCAADTLQLVPNQHWGSVSSPSLNQTVSLCPCVLSLSRCGSLTCASPFCWLPSG